MKCGTIRFGNGYINELFSLDFELEAYIQGKGLERQKLKKKNVNRYIPDGRSGCDCKFCTDQLLVNPGTAENGQSVLFAWLGGLMEKLTFRS